MFHPISKTSRLVQKTRLRLICFNPPLRHGLNISSCLICCIHILGTRHENLDDVSDSRSWRSCSVFDYWFLTNGQHASLIRLVPVGIQSSLQVSLAIFFLAKISIHCIQICFYVCSGSLILQSVPNCADLWNTSPFQASRQFFGTELNPVIKQINHCPMDK